MSTEPDGDENLRARMAHLEDRFEELAAERQQDVNALAAISPLSRRQILQAGGVAGALALLGSGTAAGAPDSNDADADLGTAASPWDVWADSIEVETDIVFQDVATDPTANGEIKRNGADLKAYSGGAVRNLSDIGAGATNVPNWVEDGNSPLNHSGSSAAAYTLASSYDFVRVFVSNIDGASSSNFQLELTVDGDTGANYDYRSIDGSLSSNASSFPAAAARSGGETGAIMNLTGRWVGACGFASMPMEFSGAVAFTGRNDNIGSPLGSFTLTQASGGNWSADIEVFGVNIN